METSVAQSGEDSPEGFGARSLPRLGSRPPVSSRRAHVPIHAQHLHARTEPKRDGHAHVAGQGGGTRQEQGLLTRHLRRAPTRT